MSISLPTLPDVEWDPTVLDSAVRLNVTGALRSYFAQDPSIRRVILRAIAPGRSGAVPFTVEVTADRGGSPAKLQSEFLKLVKGAKEVENFQQLAEGTALVFGQKLARLPYHDPASGYSIFGFQLFEQGVEVSSLASVALADPAIAARALTKLINKLTEWYGLPATVTSNVSLNITDSHINNLIGNLKTLSPPTALAVKAALKKAKLKDTPGALTRVHGDLHLENILVPRNGDYSYLIDFGNASKAGSPCIDIARLEADLIYRLLPTNYTPEQIAGFERALWAGEVEALQEHIAGYLVLTLRQNLSEVLSSPNAIKWLLAGRIFHGLRMLANTWPQVRPYNSEIRRRGIVASLGILASKLDLASAGSVVTLLINNAGKLGPSNQDVYASLAWMVKNRIYTDAFLFARDIATARDNPPAYVTLLGALAGMSSTSASRNEVEALYNLTPGQLRNPRDRGLKRLFQAMQSLRAERIPRITQAIRFFKEALELFKQSGERFFEAMTADQLARSHQEAGQIDLAKASFTDSIRLKRLEGDEVGLATSLGGLALLHLATLEYEDAHRLLQQDLDLARQQADVRSQIKIHNWLGQIYLLNEANFLQAIKHYQDSITLAKGHKDTSYDSALDLAYGNLGLGFTYGVTKALQIARKHLKVSQKLMQQGSERPHTIGTALCEILSGELLFLEGLERAGFLRVRSGLVELRDLGEKLTYIDYSIRVCRFLHSLGAIIICRQLAREARESMGSREVHFGLYRTLNDFEQEL